MPYLASNLIFNLKNCAKIQYKLINNCHVENVIIGKYFNEESPRELCQCVCMAHGAIGVMCGW
jgi:hypothetical protein